MKLFLMNKLNILLSILLVAVVGTGGYIGYKYISQNSKVIVPDFLGKDAQEVIAWCGQLNDSEACEFVYEDTSNTEENRVFQQSVSAGNELKGKITFKISSGITVEVNAPAITENTTKQDIENWKNDNRIENVSYVEENSDTVAKGNIIRIEPSSNIKNNTPVTVYISAGKKDETPETTTGSIEIKSGAYLNLTVSEFETKVKALGLVPNHRTSNDGSSSTVTKGNIVWHGSGKYEKGETINYGVCTEQTKGIVIKEGTYVGKTEAEFKTEAENLGLKATHVSSRDEYSSTVAKGSIVTHGYGTYQKEEEFKYGLSLGKKGSASDEIVIKSGQYIGKSEAEFKSAADELGLKANHVSGRDAYSSEVAKGNVVSHGYGTYEQGEIFNYGLSLGPESGSSEIVVKSGQYLNKTESEFKTIASNLGLKANHKSERDAYSTTVPKGSIVWHGYGTYVKDENFNYGLSLGSNESGGANQTIQISQGQYVGKSEADFKSAAEALGLKPTHIDGRDAYSSTIAKGNIVTHGYGSYVKNEEFKYGLSLGPEPAVEKINVASKTGSTVDELKSYLEGLGMKLGTKSEAYSSSVAQGLVISNDTGEYAKGSSINYKVSLGNEPEATAYIMRPENYGPIVNNSTSFETTKNALQNTFSAFENIEFIQASSIKAVGQIEKIEVDGSASYTEGYYPVSTSIKVYIVATQIN